MLVPSSRKDCDVVGTKQMIANDAIRKVWSWGVLQGTWSQIP